MSLTIQPSIRVRVRRSPRLGVDDFKVVACDVLDRLSEASGLYGAFQSGMGLCNLSEKPSDTKTAGGGMVRPNLEENPFRPLSETHAEAASTLPFYVIGVNYWSGAQLARLIRSLAPLSYVKKFIVVNHSPEERLQLPEAPFPVTVIRRQNLGYGAGLNAGIREITERESVVLFCNPDVQLLTPETVIEPVRILSSFSSVGCIAPTLLDEEGNRALSIRTFYSVKTLLAARLRFLRKNSPKFLRDHYYMDQLSSEPMEVDWGCGAAMFYRVGALPERSPFDERFFLYMEDVDLCARIWRAGRKVLAHPDVVFLHKGSFMSRKRLSFLFRHVSSLVKYVVKYRGFPRRRSLLKAANLHSSPDP